MFLEHEVTPRERTLQGYLTYKKTHPLRTLPRVLGGS